MKKILSVLLLLLNTYAHAPTLTDIVDRCVVRDSKEFEVEVQLAERPSL